MGYIELLAKYTYNVVNVREKTDLKINQVGGTATATVQYTMLGIQKASLINADYRGTFTYVYTYEAGKWKLFSVQHSDLSKAGHNKAINRALNKVVNEKNHTEYGKFYADTHEIKGLAKGPQASEGQVKAYEKTFPALQVNNRPHS